VINRYVGNLAPMPGVFPDYPAPVVRNTAAGSEMVLMRWGMPPPPRTGGPPSSNAKGHAFLDRLPLAPADMKKFSHGSADALLKLNEGK
jgi:hypothetical protein